jgi:2-polyprenyl-3-methyl-5-hydroxy-6-metoxy-1,4-benzoquinol methylase
MPIHNGAVDLLIDPPVAIQNEIRGQVAQRAGDLPPDVAQRRAEKYRALDLEEFRRANMEGALAHVHLRPGMTVLDMGAGDGWLAPVLAGRGMHYLGIDVLYPDDLVALSSAGSFLKADLNAPPLKDNSFDLIVTSAALHHAYDLRSAIVHIGRMLKPGGVFLAISEPTKGLLKNNSLYACDAHPCLNENVYWVWEYIHIARRAGLRPHTYLPGYVCRRLDARDTRGLRFGGLGAIVARLWQVDWVRALLNRHGYLPASLLFGMPMVMIAKNQV